MNIKGKIIKINWYCKENEIKMWRDFSTWLWLDCELTPLDFACLSFFEKTLFMMAFWSYHSGYNEMDICLEHLKKEARKLCRNSVAALADRTDKADFLKSRKYEGDYNKFTFFGKENDKP